MPRTSVRRPKTTPQERASAFTLAIRALQEPRLHRQIVASSPRGQQVSREVAGMVESLRKRLAKLETTRAPEVFTTRPRIASGPLSGPRSRASSRPRSRPRRETIHERHMRQTAERVEEGIAHAEEYYSVESGRERARRGLKNERRASRRS